MSANGTDINNLITNSSIPENVQKDGITAGSWLYFLFLLFVCVFGTIGNAMTMVAVRIERKLRQAICNYLILNLTAADSIVCALVVPVVMANTLIEGKWLDNTLCYFSAAISGVACHTAAITMTFIALNRYVAAQSGAHYSRYCTKQRVMMAISVSWIFAVANTAPILLAWMEVDYDFNRYVCICFDGTFPLKYTLVPVFVGHFIPHAITIFCYARLLKVLSESRRRVAKTKTAASCATAISATDDKNSSKIGSTSDDLCEASDGIMKGVKNWSRHEIQMFKTSIWIIVFFSFCWIPYGILVVLQDLAPIALKQVFGALCLLSFSVNPVIYGVLSRSFRQAYKRMLNKMFCWRAEKLKSRTVTIREQSGIPTTSAH